MNVDTHSCLLPIMCFMIPCYVFQFRPTDTASWPVLWLPWHWATVNVIMFLTVSFPIHPSVHQHLHLSVLQLSTLLGQHVFYSTVWFIFTVLILKLELNNSLEHKLQPTGNVGKFVCGFQWLVFYSYTLSWQIQNLIYCKIFLVFIFKLITSPQQMSG